MQSLIGTVSGIALFSDGLPESQPVLIDLVLSRSASREVIAMAGELRRVYKKDNALWVMDVYPGKFTSKFNKDTLEKKSEKALDFKARIGFFLEWALVRLSDKEGACPVRACVVVDGVRDGWEASLNTWDAAFMRAVEQHDAETRSRMIEDLEERVVGLLAFWQRSQQQPQWYFPKTSWVALVADVNETVKAWSGGFERKGERDYSPGYARLLAGERDFSADDGADYDLLIKNAARLLALVTLTSGKEQAA